MSDNWRINTRTEYVGYLIPTPTNSSCSNLAEHLDSVSHNAVTDYMQRERLSASHLWEVAEHFSEKCQCRKQRSQRNHLANCYYAWFSLTVQARVIPKISAWRVEKLRFNFIYLFKQKS